MFEFWISSVPPFLKNEVVVKQKEQRFIPSEVLSMDDMSG